MSEAMPESTIDNAGNRLCKKCPFIISAQKEYHKLCMQVNRKFGGIRGVTCGTNGWNEKEANEYYNRIGLDIETGLPKQDNEESVILKLKKKLENDFVYYSNATIGWPAPDLVARANYAHELLEWVKEQLREEPYDIRKDANA